MENLSDRIKEARSNAGLTQSQLASKASVSRNYIAQVEMGKRKPGIKTLEAIATSTGLNILDLLKGDEYIERLSEIASKKDVGLLKEELKLLLLEI